MVFTNGVIKEMVGILKVKIDVIFNARGTTRGDRFSNVKYRFRNQCTAL